LLQGCLAYWRRLDLARQFLLVSILVIVTSMLLLGRWVSARIEGNATQSAALSTAFYAENFVAPMLQSLAEDDQFRADVQAGLDRLITETPFGQRVVSYKVWRRAGEILYASDKSTAGRTFPAGSNQRAAWTGQVAAEFDNLSEPEHAGERAKGVPVLEIYVPIRRTYSDQIIAVAEFYADARTVKSEIFQAKLEAWLLLGVAGLFAVATLYGMVARANRTILDQRSALQQQITKLSSLLEQNTELRRRLERSSERAAEVNERYLRRLGSELHDGPAQLLSLALLRLDASRGSASATAGVAVGGGTSRPRLVESRSAAADDTAIIRSALTDALAEIRNLSVGLSLPALEPLSLEATLLAAVRSHEQRTGTHVDLDVGALPPESSHAIKSTAYRFVQEGLNNAIRHAKGAGQRVAATNRDGIVEIEITDRGPGFDAASLAVSGRLGLAGLRERIEASGGVLEIEAATGRGTRLRARLPVDQGARADA
jgi:signal transduction histidine kinase